MKKLLKFYPTLILGYSILPLVASAQSSGQITGILNNVLANARTIITILFVFATLVFLWGLISFIAKGDNPDAQKKAKSVMTWGIIGLAVMGSAWGLTLILTQYFGVESGAIPSTVR